MLIGLAFVSFVIYWIVIGDGLKNGHVSVGELMREGILGQANMEGKIFQHGNGV